MKFRKKPVVIEAQQLTGDSLFDLMRWINSNDGKTKEWGWDDDDRYLIISTLEGNMKAQAGDWIIRGVQGEFYPCKSDIFEATYEKVE